jgi:DNA-binding GntR family transcriptional regulator
MNQAGLARTIGISTTSLGDPCVARKWSDIHRRFHAAICCASHNDQLIGSLDELWDKADRYRLLAFQIDRDGAARERMRVEHENLMEGVVVADADQSCGVMEAHIEASLNVRSGVVAQRTGPDTQPFVTGPHLDTVG